MIPKINSHYVLFQIFYLQAIHFFFLLPILLLKDLFLLNMLYVAHVLTFNIYQYDQIIHDHQEE